VQRVVQHPDAAAVIASRRAFSTAGQPCSAPNAATSAIEDTARNGGQAPDRGQSLAHHQFVLGVDQRLRPGAHRDPGRTGQRGQWLGGDAFVVEG